MQGLVGGYASYSYSYVKLCRYSVQSSYVDFKVVEVGLVEGHGGFNRACRL